MPEYSVQDYLYAWREKFGELTAGKKYGNTFLKIPVKGRKEALVVFFKEMKKLGYDKERFSRPSFIQELIPYIFGEAPWTNREQQKRAHGALASEVKYILDGNIWDDKKTIEEKSKLFNETPDPVPEYIETGGGAGGTTNFVPSSGSHGTSETSIPGKGSADPSPEERFGKEVDRSLYSHLPKTQVVLDEEFAKLIGVDPDE